MVNGQVFPCTMHPNCSINDAGYHIQEGNQGVTPPHLQNLGNIPKLPKDSVHQPTSDSPSPSKGLLKATQPDNTIDSEVDNTIDVRYAPDLETAFNRFIKKWCGGYYAHLIDSDENDGQFIRDKAAQSAPKPHHHKEG